MLGFFRRKEKAQRPANNGGWFSIVSEPFTGAWQRNQEMKSENIIQYPTLYACINRVATDIGKLPFCLKTKKGEIWQPAENKDYSWIRKPNHFQSLQQFLESWLLSKLTQGNTYALKVRNAKGAVIGLYVLDPHRVMPLVTDNGDVYYQLNNDNLRRLNDGFDVTVPASEIIHDRCMSPLHPLIGLPPLAAANWPALKNMRIVKSNAEFFANNAQPSGVLTAPGPIKQENAEMISKRWKEKFSGVNAGSVAVIGDGMTFAPLAAKSVDSQMIEQLRYSDEQICQPFGIPPFKVGIGSVPAGMKVDDINQLYYSDALQVHIESIENLLDIALDIPASKSLELDLMPLLRMDSEKKAEVEAKLVGGAIKTPNEGRATFDLLPKYGGDSIYLQQQNYSLEALSRRDADPLLWQPKNLIPPAQPAPPEPEPEPDPAPEDQAKMLAILLKGELAHV